MSNESLPSIQARIPVVNPNRFIHIPSLKIGQRKNSNGTLISEWLIHHDFHDYRLYIQPISVDDEYQAFDFEVVGLLRANPDDQPSYDNPESLIRSVCHGHCNGNGIRYSYFGDPLLGGTALVEELDPKALAEALMYVSLYQKKWCVDAD